MLTILFELKISRVAVQKIHKNSKNGSFCDELLSENDFETVFWPVSVVMTMVPKLGNGSEDCYRPERPFWSGQA